MCVTDVGIYMHRRAAVEEHEFLLRAMSPVLIFSLTSCASSLLRETVMLARIPQDNQSYPRRHAAFGMVVTWSDPWRSAYQRIADRETGKALEIAVGGPDLVFTMMVAQRRAAGVVHMRANDASGLQHAAELFPATLTLAEQDKRR